MGGHKFDPFDCYAEFDRSRRQKGVLNNAPDTGREESHEEHAEAIQGEEKSESGILCLDQKEETRIEQVARVVKPGRVKKEKPPKPPKRKGMKDMVSKRWLKQQKAKQKEVVT